MLKECICTKDAPQAIGPYSQAIRLGDFVFISGQLPVDVSTGNLVEDDIKLQTKQCLKNIEAILNEINLNLSHVLRTTVYMSDLNEFNEMNEVYASCFEEPYPSRSTVQVAALPKGAKVEIEVMAIDTLALEVMCCEESCSCNGKDCE